MKIGLDFDGVITEEPSGFFHFATMMRQFGHKVYIVTMRYESESEEIYRDWGKHVDGVHATGRQAKSDFMKNLGIDIHVWIDDTPRAAHESALSIWGWSSPEGHVMAPVHNDTGNGFVTELAKKDYYSGMRTIDTCIASEILIHIEKPKND